MRRLVAVLAFALLAVACSDPSPASADFVVDVDGERFVTRVTDPATIVAFREAMTGRAAGFPIGPLRRGDGGFNQPWTWHLDPDATRLAEVAIEVCDGRPTYVEANQADFPSYCPWGARIVAER